MSETWLKLTACEMGHAIGRGDIDPLALTEQHLEAIEAHPDRARVFTKVTAERARAEALASAERARHGARRHLLDGVPISWKDLFDMAGERSDAGTKMLEDETGPAQADAPCVARAAAAGLVAIGRTHMTELAFSGLGVNPVTATAPNVNDPDWAPGGSSSGAAASVSLGLAAAGIGSDTGGSVRIPSAWQNLVGLKTTQGLIPLEGSVPLAAFLDTVGPLCRSVEDAAQLTAVMASRPAPDLANTSLKGRRILVDEATMLADCEPEPLKAFEDALARLADAGAEIARGEIPEFADSLPLTRPILVAEAWAEWGERIEAKGDRMFHQIRKRTEAGRDVSAAEHIRARKRLDELRASYLARTAGYDAVAMPSAAIKPPSVSRLLSDDDYYEQINLMALRNTRIANLLGLCSLTLPTPEPGCGLMFYAAPFTEGALCRLGHAAEPVVRG